MKKKSFILHFLIVCGTIIVLMLSISVVCYRIVTTKGAGNGTYIEQMDDYR